MGALGLALVAAPAVGQAASHGRPASGSHASAAPHVAAAHAFGTGSHAASPRSASGHAGASRGDTGGHGRSVAVASRGGARGSHVLTVAAFSRHLGGNGRFGIRIASAGGGISCVPFARNESGIELAGNAATWWDHAEGVYARGSVPEVGGVLNFRANGRMHLGHVAVVADVVNSRVIEIDHANWWGPGAQGGVARNIPVVDVSPNNDWTAVRVGLGRTGDYGSVYPTFGFIYDRPDRGQMVASDRPTARMPLMNAAPSDLRSGVQLTRVAATIAPRTYDEVAEAPAGRPHLDLSLPGDAPNRDLR